MPSLEKSEAEHDDARDLQDIVEVYRVGELVKEARLYHRACTHLSSYLQCPEPQTAIAPTPTPIASHFAALVKRCHVVPPLAATCQLWEFCFSILRSSLP